MVQAAKLFCVFVNAFREKPLEDELDSWPKIQKFISVYVTRFMSDILCNIKNKVLVDLNDSSAAKDLTQERLRKIKEEFFVGENLKLFKHVSGHKNLKVIVYLVFNVIAFVLEEPNSSQTTQSMQSKDSKKSKQLDSSQN